MSQYQYVAFRAIDAPVSGKNLKFMRDQSTRAEVTAWSFENEYHFGGKATPPKPADSGITEEGFSERVIRDSAPKLGAFL
jgi:hypothetical protein